MNTSSFTKWTGVRPIFLFPTRMVATLDMPTTLANLQNIAFAESPFRRSFLLRVAFAASHLLPLCFQPDQNESAEILKIKQSMQEEAKRFEKDTPSDPSHPEYFMSQ